MLVHRPFAMEPAYCLRHLADWAPGAEGADAGQRFWLRAFLRRRAEVDSKSWKHEHVTRRAEFYGASIRSGPQQRLLAFPPSTSRALHTRTLSIRPLAPTSIALTKPSQTKDEHGRQSRLRDFPFRARRSSNNLLALEKDDLTRQVGRQDRSGSCQAESYEFQLAELARGHVAWERAG